MHTQTHIRHAYQIISALFICLGLLSPSLALAQTVTPPPPPTLEQRWALANAPHPDFQNNGLAPNAVQFIYIPWTRFAWQSYDNGNSEIYYVDNAAPSVRVTNNNASDIQPSFNRGSNCIAFASNRTGSYEIFRVNPNGSALTQLTKNAADDVAPVWSPDGTKIAFQSYRDGQSEIYVMNADGTQQIRLTNDAGYDGEPAWSPDGSQIAFTSNRSGGYRIWVMGPSGANPVMLNAQVNSEHPVWSPDSQQIAFDADGDVGDQNGWQELWVMNADGSNQHWIQQPTNINQDLYASSWSPDGRYVAFTQVGLIYQNNTWYWTYAQMKLKDLTMPLIEDTILGDGEWNPDWQVTDAVPPTSSLTSQPYLTGGTINLNWSGSDTGGSGLRGFDVQIKDGASSAWTDWYHGTILTSGWYHATGGHTYFFRVRARDNAYNVEPWPADYQATISTEWLPPVTAVQPLPAYSNTDVTVTWGGYDQGGTGIRGYDVQVRTGKDGPWTDWLVNISYTSSTFLATPGNTYYFRCRGTDYLQNVESWPPGDGDTQVTFYSWQFSGFVHDVTGAPLSGSQVITNPASVNAAPSDASGNFTEYGGQNSSTYTATWSKTGYGSLPQTTYSSDNDPKVDIALPPGDNLVQGGDFETSPLDPTAWQISGTLPASINTDTFHTGQSSVQLGEMVAPGWRDIEHVSDAGGLAYTSNPSPQIVVDSAGTVHAIWVSVSSLDNSKSLYYGSKPAGGSWSTPIILADPITSGNGAMALDASDTLYVAWSDSGLFYKTKPKSGGWSAPVATPVGDIYTLSIVLDGSGTLHVLMLNSNGLYYVAESGSQWTSPSKLDQGGNDLNLLVNPQGTVHALWTSYYVKPGSVAVAYASKPKDGSWGLATPISTGNNASGANMTIDETGALYAAWQLNGNVSIEYRAKQPGSAWSAPETIAYGDTTAGPKVAAGSGKVGIVFSSASIHTGVSSAFLTVKSAGTPWSSPFMISPEYQSLGYTDAAIGADGKFRVVGDRTTGSSSYGQYVPEEIFYREQTLPDPDADGSIAQSLTILDSMAHPALSFYYNLTIGSVTTPPAFSVTLQPTTGGKVSLFTTSQVTSDWTFRSVDLTTWKGQAVTLKFNIHHKAGYLPVIALVDDVALGSAYPDLWVSSNNTRGLPGDQVTFNIGCGNHGGVAAPHAGLTISLPPGLTFVKAVPAPVDPTASTLTWGLGDLAPKSNACSVSLTATIDPAFRIPHTLTADVQITTSSTELEVDNNVVHPTADMPYYYTFVPSVKK